MNTYLSIDTETFGLGLESTLLTTSYIIADENFKVDFSFVVRLKPNDGIYHGTPYSLDINKIDLVEHDKVATSYREAGTILYNLLNSASDKGKNKLIVIGKNVHFDLTHIWDKLIGRATWETFCSYQLLDLTSVWKFLEITGKVPVLPSTSLGSLCDFLSVDKGTSHDAYSDALATLNCMKKLTSEWSPLIDVSDCNEEWTRKCVDFKHLLMVGK